MIEIVYHRKYHGVTVTGHAKSGEKGHDLVCAAVSALVLTLATNVSGLASRDILRDYNVRTADGEADISCVPVRRMGDVVSLIYDTVCNGMEMLSSHFPEYITYQVLG